MLVCLKNIKDASKAAEKWVKEGWQLMVPERKQDVSARAQPEKQNTRRWKLLICGFATGIGHCRSSTAAHQWGESADQQHRIWAAAWLLLFFYSADLPATSLGAHPEWKDIIKGILGNLAEPGQADTLQSHHMGWDGMGRWRLLRSLEKISSWDSLDCSPKGQWVFH